MKIYRPLVVLFLFSCGLAAFAQDSSEFTSLRAKAVKGNGIAQYNLGLAYAQGKGTAVDPVEAFVWLSLARENGARGRALDNLVGSLDRATYETAQKRLAERKAELGLKTTAAPSAPATAPVETAVAPDLKPAGPAAPATPSTPGAPADDAALARLRTERDALAAQITDLSGNVSALRAERERLIKLSADNEKAAREAADAGRAAEARAGEATKAGEAAKAELERARQALAALQAAPKPLANTAALDQKTRELQAALAELEASRSFGTQVESTLNKVTDQKTALERQLATAGNESNRLQQETAAATRAREEAQQKLTAVAAEHAALQSEVAQLRSRPAAPAYPDLSSRVRELEAQVAAKPAAPGYPDLSGKVGELESQLAQARQPVAPKYPDLSGRVTELEAALVAARQPAAPKYPDLSGRVRELESSLADLSSEAARAKQEIATLAKAKEDTQRQLAAKPAAPAWPDLRSNVAALEGQLASAQQALAAKSKPVVDTAALDQKNRELAAALAELEASRTFGRKVEDTLNKVNDEKARVAAAAAAELEAARNFGTQVESTLNKVTDQKTALERQLATAGNEANRVREEAAALAKARDEAQQQANAIKAEHAALQAEVAQFRSRPAAPAYPDLSGRVRELEAQASALGSEAGRAKQEIAALTKAREADSSAVAAAKAETTGVRQEVAKLAQARDEAQKALAARPAAPSYPDLSGRVTELEAALVAARQPAAPAAPDLSGKVRELETALADASRQLVAAQNAKPAAPAYPDLSGRVTELEAAVATAIQKFGAAEQARVETAKQFDDFKIATSAAQRDRTTMTAQVKMLESDKAALRRQVDAATTETAQLRTQLAGVKMQQAAIKPTVPAYPDLSGKVGELEAQVNTLNAALAAKPAAPAWPDLSGRVTELEASLADSRRQLAAKPAAPAYPDLSGRVRELEMQVSALTSEATRAKQDVAALSQAREASSSAATAAQAQITSLTAERDTARNAQKEMRDTIAKLAQEKVQLTAASTDAPAWPDLRERVASLESDLSARSFEVTRAKQDLMTLTQAKDEAQKALAARPAAPAYPDLSGRVGELEAALAAARTAAPAYPDLSGRVSELETKLATAEKSAAEKPAAPSYPDLSGRVTELNGEVTQLRTDRERMQKMLADAGRQLRENTAATSRVKDLEAQVASLQLQGTITSKSDRPDPWGRVLELEGKLAAAEKSAEDSARQLIAAEAAQTGLKQQLAEAGTALENAAKGGDDSAKFRRERDELSGRVTELAGEVAQLRTDRERMQKMLADAGRQLRDTTADSTRIKELETQLAASQAQAGGIVTERDAARSAQNELRDTIARLEQDKAALSIAAAEASRPRPEVGAPRPTVPAYPDLSGRVRELEAQIAAAPRSRTPGYPDLSGRVSELEAALAEARQRPASSAAPATGGGDSSELQQKLAATEDRLATSLRGYAMLERERDELAANVSKTTAAIAAEKNALAAQVTALSGEVAQLRAGAQSTAGSTQAEIARLGEALAALQRSTAQNSTDLAATRALAQQLQGANAVLAGENYQLKTMLSRTGTPAGPAAITAAAPAPRTHVVASGDSLSRLSQRYYGTAGRWQEIYGANTDRIAANGVLRIGTELRIP